MLTWLSIAAGAAVAAANDPGRLTVEHESELLDSNDGLPSSSSTGISQDDRGWLWVTTSEGIARMDGAHTIQVTGPHFSLVDGSGVRNRIVAADDVHHTLVDLVGDSLRPFGPSAVIDAQVDSAGRVWAVVGDTLVLEAPGGAWKEVDGPWQVPPDLLGPSRDGAVIVDASDTLFRVREDHAVPLGAVSGAIGAVERDDGTVLVIANTNPETNDDGAVLALRGGVWRTLYAPGHRVIDIAAGREDVFVNFDFATVRLDAEDRADLLSPPPNCCGGILADREGGVWIATIYGVRHYPSPTTRAFDVGGAIHVAPAAGGVWVSTWAGFRYVTRNGTSWSNPVSGMAPCTDAAGATWGLTGASPARLHTDGPPEILPALPFAGPFVGCALGADGRTWFASMHGVLVSDAVAPIPHPVAALLPPAAIPERPGDPVVLEKDGDLVLGIGNRICRAAVYRVLRDADPSWSCSEVPDQGIVVDLEAAPDGAIWAAVSGVGVLRWVADAWLPIPASKALRTGTLGQLTASPRGGVWVLAEGDAIRVIEEPDSALGWSVLERLGETQGVRRVATPTDLVETNGGDLWLVTVDGLVTFIPASARALTGPAPPVFLSAVVTDDGPRDPAVPLALAHGRSGLDVQFAAPVFGARSLLEYRHRLDPREPWSTPTRDASVQFAALGTGSYTVEVQASTDGRHWSVQPATYAFRVKPPWYLQGWFVLTVGAVVATVAFLSVRIRRQSVMRLERQRVRIARDLHDEIGSGLGSIGLLAAIAGRAPVPSSEIVGRIAALAAELGTNLTDIVTSLRGGAANLRSLHAHIVDRGVRLCPSGNPRFDAAPTSDIPAIPLMLAVRVNVFNIAIEAIHNAVKHARAGTIRLELGRASRGTWLLSVTDDGCGLPFAGSELPPRVDGAPGGMGLRGMLDRAAEIGAQLTWAAAPGGGTVIELRFDPRADQPNRVP